MKIKNAIFISFEGIDGCGKSTQAKLLYEYFNSTNNPVYFTREPGGTPLSESLRDILLNNETGNISSLSELFLYLASRREHFIKIIKPILDLNISVICDRFTDSSIAYQGFGRGINQGIIDNLNSLTINERYPDITFLIDIDPDISSDRMSYTNLDRLEGEGFEFSKSIRDGYLCIAKVYKERIKVIDGNRTISEIHNEIVNYILNKVNIN